MKRKEMKIESQKFIMALYINQTGILKAIKEKPFKLKKDIQKVFEANLTTIIALNWLRVS